ncbi:uncharacterized protein LOC143268397 [Peromyscus maniculatus bairdii]|uniref:uncharacterized protein LOC143268397 n=1 Tax=Peromyscus maniculatus bairdii TaxID=230844 RepID=UPI003FD08687
MREASDDVSRLAVPSTSGFISRGQRRLKRGLRSCLLEAGLWEDISERLGSWENCPSAPGEPEKDAWGRSSSRLAASHDSVQSSDIKVLRCLTLWPKLSKHLPGAICSAVLEPDSTNRKH